MSRIAVSTFLAVLTLAVAPTGLSAQTSSQTPPPARPPITVASPEQVAIQNRLEEQEKVFAEAVEAMYAEMGEAVEDAGGVAQAKFRLDAIQTRYQPAADAFADALKAYADQTGALPDHSRGDVESALTAVETIRRVPALVRSQFERSHASAPGEAP